MNEKNKSFYIPKDSPVQEFREDQNEKEEFNKLFEESSLESENKKIEEKIIEENLSFKKTKLSTTRNSVDLTKISKRTLSRIIALQFCYLQNYDENIRLEEFKKEIPFLWELEYQSKLINKNIIDYSEKIIKTIISKKDEITTEVKLHLKENWSWERIGIINQSIFIMIISCFYLGDVDDSAILFNEAILISKWFSDKDDYKFINGILEKINKKLFVLD